MPWLRRRPCGRCAGLPLPAYTNWRAGLTFSYNVFKLGLNYTDTTLSKEHCYVMTGDLGAIAGGVSTFLVAS